VEVPLRLGTLCRTEVVEAPPEPTIYIQQLPTGGRVDALLDPGELGRNDVHFTFIPLKPAYMAVPTSGAS